MNDIERDYYEEWIDSYGEHNVDRALRIAQTHALLNPEKYVTPTDFLPHRWVIGAILEAVWTERTAGVFD
jgi:hypothetical protein